MEKEPADTNVETKSMNAGNVRVASANTASALPFNDFNLVSTVASTDGVSFSTSNLAESGEYVRRKSGREIPFSASGYGANRESGLKLRYA